MLLPLLLVAAIASASAAGPSWTIYHSFNGGEDFSRRGVLAWSEDEESFLVTNDEQALTKQSLEAMLEFGWYQVKIENSDSDYVLATVPACNVRRANFKDEFQVTLPRTAERITSVSYTPLVSPLAPKTCEELETMILNDETGSIALTSKVQATLDTPGLTLRAVLPHTKPPPGLKFMTHPNAKKGSAAGAADPNAEPETGPQGFLKKYWYVLLPLFLANFMGGTSEEPPQQQQQDGGSAPPQGGAAAALPAASGGGGTPSKGRRGKHHK
jgi:hypothetical protein